MTSHRIPIGIALAMLGIAGCYRASEFGDPPVADAFVLADAGLDARASRDATVGDSSMGRDAARVGDTFVADDAVALADAYRPPSDAQWDDARYAPMCPFADGSVGIDGAIRPSTIDRIATVAFATYRRIHGLAPVYDVPIYYLSDGTSWDGGAGTHSRPYMHSRGVEVSGTTLRFHMTSEGLLWSQTDFGTGDHSANFRLDAVDELIIVAERGSTTAVLDTYVRVSRDEPATFRDEDHHDLSAGLCADVHFTTTYMLREGTVDESLFDSDFEFFANTVVDFRMTRP